MVSDLSSPYLNIKGLLFIIEKINDFNRDNNNNKAFFKWFNALQGALCALKSIQTLNRGLKRSLGAIKRQIKGFKSHIATESLFWTDLPA